MNKMKLVLAAGALLIIGALAVSPSHAAVPSNGATIQDRAVPTDGNGRTFLNNSEIGYKVFVATSPSAIVLLDENGVAPTSGLIHQICLSSGTAATEWAVVYDSAPPTLANLTAANQGVNVIYEHSPVVNRLTSAEHCSPVLDTQFNVQPIVLQSASQGTAHIFWRPSRGGRN